MLFFCCIFGLYLTSIRALGAKQLPFLFITLGDERVGYGWLRTFWSARTYSTYGQKKFFGLMICIFFLRNSAFLGNFLYKNPPSSDRVIVELKKKKKKNLKNDDLCV